MAGMRRQTKFYGGVKMAVKRFLDILLSIIGILLASPLILVIILLVYIKLGKPILFTQDRVGINGKIFKMYKFRTMLNTTDKDGNLLPDNERLTPFGRKLRSTSLDELPELINVLKGEMSLVGPRPLLVDYLPLYSQEQMKRHNMRPGITGWAQVNGRNSIDWKTKFEFDVWYVENWSLMLDFKILLMTLVKVFKKEGICADGSATAERFNGAN